MTSMLNAAGRSFTPSLNTPGRGSVNEMKSSPTSVQECINSTRTEDNENQESMNESVSNLSKRMERVALESNTSSTEDQMNYPLREIRNQIFRLITSVGSIAIHFVARSDNDELLTNNQTFNILNDKAICFGMVKVLEQVLKLADQLSLSLVSVVEMKMELNRRKYPVHLCKGKAGKYTEYSEYTGITKEKGQETLTVECKTGTSAETNAAEKFIPMIPVLTSRINEFAMDREWDAYHTPRNLLLALTGELGELAELVQFKGDDTYIQFTEKELEKLGQEVADVTIYLLRLADVCSVDLHAEIQQKIQKNKCLQNDIGYKIY